MTETATEFCRGDFAVWEAPASLKLSIEVILCIEMKQSYCEIWNEIFDEMKFSMESIRSCCQPKMCPLICSIFWSVIGVWVKIWHRINWQNHMSLIQSCAKQQIKIDHLSEKRASAQIQIDSSATSDGGAQKLGNYVWNDSDLIATRLRVCSQICWNWNAMFESHVVTRVDTGQDKLWFLIWIFFEQYPANMSL